MALNLTQIYTIKSNAQAALRKAITKGQASIGEFTVVPLSGGFRIVPAPQPEPAEAVAPESEIAADDAAAMTDALAASRDAHVPPGLARLRAEDDAAAIRESVLADQEKALTEAAAASEHPEMQAFREELITDPKVTIGAAVMADYRAEHPAPEPATPPPSPAPVRRGRKPASPKPAAKLAASPGGVSSEAVKVLRALFFSPALPLMPDDKVGVWVDYKTINESDRPHGLAVRSVPGYIAGLQRRGLVECRMEKPGKFSARMTAAGVALVQEAGR